MTEQAEISQGRKLSGIWIIPLLALVLGIYMVIHTWMTEGPDITITFKTASGLEAGKTKIKYRNVDMGLVEEIRLSDDFERVVAKAKLERQALPLLREDTRFWVVTARVGLGQVSGLETLLSGAYVELAPGTGTEGRRDFVAEESPPLTPTDAAGLRVVLTADRASSVSAGDTVLYKGYQVGRVESRDFDPEEAVVRYVVFIDAPYHELVNSAVRFWDVSGVSLSAGAEGFQIQTGSLDTILTGGVAFILPPGIKAGKPVDHNTRFKLYSSYEDILRNPYRHGTHFVVRFEQSIKGLLPGAPVEYRGIPVGRVERIMIEENMRESLARGMESQGDPIPVLIYLEPGRVALPDTLDSIELFQTAIRSGVPKGMRASLETGNLLTGARYIGIDYYKGLEPATHGEYEGYPTIPSIPSGMGQIEKNLNAVLAKIEALPLETTVERSNEALASLDATLESLHGILESDGIQQLPAEVESTLAEVRSVVNGLSPDSELYQSLNSSLAKLNRSLANLESLSRTLAEQPNAAVMPSKSTPDPMPEVRQ